MDEFIQAIQAGDVAKVEQMLSAAPELKDSRASNGVSAVQTAVYSFQPEIRDLLLSRGAMLDLAGACSIGACERVKDLVTPDNVDGRSPDGFPYIALAAAFGGPETVQALISAGADLNARSTGLGGVAALHASVFGRQYQSMQLLLEAGADANQTQEGGFTALMGAAQNGHEHAVRTLLEHGADPAMRTDEGKTAADVAREAGHNDLIPILATKSL